MTETTDTADTAQAESFSQLAKFKQRVRAEAIRVAKEQGWCDSGLNDTLRALGLPPKREFLVPVEYTVTLTRTASVYVNDAQTEAEAYERVRSNPDLIKEYTPHKGTVSDWRVPEPPKLPEAGSGVPVPGDPCPEEGPFYARAVISGGPNQCRVTDERAGVYCTRPLEHTPDWHVAAGANAGVLSTWEVKDGDVRSTPARDSDDEYEDDDED